MDQKGYDFSGSKYGGVVILPALNLTDYSVVTAKGGSDAAPVATTKFTLISDTVDYTASVTSNSYFVINNGEAKYYSRYDCSLANNENETLSWDEETGYFNYNAVNPVTYSASSLTLRAYGTMAILVGDITLNFSSRWGFNKGLIIGNGTDATTVTLTSSATDYALVPFDGSYLEIRNNATLDITGSGSSGNLAPQNGGDVFVAEGGTLNVKANAGDAIKAPNTGSRMIVDGTVTATGNVSFAGGAITSDTEEYGFAPAIYVRKGTITISGRVWTNSLQIGSEELNAYGTLNVTASKDLVQTVSQTTLVKHVLAKGTFNAKNTSTTARCAMKIDTSNTGYLDVKEEMTINLTGSFGSVFGEWKAGTYHVAIQEGAIVSPDAKIAHSKLTVYIYTWKTATININGTEKEVIIVNTLTCPEGTPYYTFNGIDRPSVVEEATYTSTENTVSCGHLGTFNEATYTDADSITHTIYYQEIA